MSFAVFAQTTVTIFSTGASGSYTTGFGAAALRVDGNIESGGPGTVRGYAVFDLNSIPASATITSCVIGFYVSGYTGGGTPSGWDTYGYPGNLSTVTTAATLYADMISGTSLSTATYGTAVGAQTLASTAASTTFIQGQAGNTISICWTGGGSKTYTIYGETGAAATTGTNFAPYLQITYTCPGVSGVTASATPNPVCVGYPLTLTGTGSGTTSYSWSGPGGYTSASESASLTTTALSNGVYTLTAYTAAGCGTQAVTATVNLSATPAGIITGSPLLFCQGQDVLLAATAAAGYTYQWYQSGAAISGATNQTYTDGLNGSFTVDITNTTTGCANMTPPVIVSVLPLDPFLTPAGTDKICVGSYTTLGVDLTGIVTTGLFYQWEKAGIAISGANSSTYTTDSNGVYTCIMTTSTCNDTSQSTTVTIDPLPYPNVAFNDGILSTSNLYTSYQWFLNLVAIPGATSHTLAAPDNGSYRVEVTDTNGCKNYSDPYAVYNLGIAQINNAGIKIYPNPAEKTVYISSAVSVRAVISTIDGKKIMEKNDAADIDVSELPSGIYIIELYNDGGARVAIDKLIKE